MADNTYDTEDYFVEQIQRFVRSVGWGVTLLGVFVLIGWALELEALKGLLPGLATMKANTAIGFIFLGVALYHSLKGSSRISLGLSLLLVVLALLVIIQYAFGWNPGIDEIFFQDTATPEQRFPGRMSGATAINFTLLGGALALIALKRFYAVAQLMALVAAIISLMSLLGYAYGVSALYRLYFYNSIALHTAVGFLLASVAVFLLRPRYALARLFIDRGPGGTLVRRLVPMVIFVPIVIGWLIIAAEQVGLIENAIAVELFVIISIVAFLGVTWWNASAVQKTDLELLKVNRAYRTLSGCNQILIRAEDEALLMQHVCEKIVEEGAYRIARIELDEMFGTSLHIAPAPMSPDYGALRVTELTVPALRTGQPQTAMHIANDPVWREDAAVYGFNTLMVLPIRDNGTIYGTLQVFSADHSFSSTEVDLLKELAGDVGFGIKTLRIRDAHRDAEERLRYQAGLLENIPDAVISTDLDFHIRSWNKGAEHIYGWTEAEVLGKTTSEVLKTRLLDGSSATGERFIERGGWKGEVLEFRRDGTPVNILSSASVVKNAAGEPIGVVGVNRDITELFNVAEVITTFEEKFRALFDEALDVVLILDSQTGHILSANRAATVTLGYDALEIEGQPFSALVPHETVEFLEQVLTQGSVYMPEALRHRNGIIVPMDLTATIIPWEGDKAILVTLRDMTEFQQLTKELFEAEMKRATLEQDRQLVQMREDFIATITHDFRNPLGVIVASSDMVLKYRDKMALSRVFEHMQQILTQALNMRALMEDVLDLSKSRAGKYKLNPEPVDVQAFCRDMIAQFKLVEAKDKPHTFKFAAHGDLRDARMDKEILRRVLSNILSNAIKYSPNGGEISLEIARDGDVVKFLVQDQGIGIPINDLPHVFEPFSRAANTQGIAGTGLGMPIVKERIELHGGSIAIDSVEGQGTTIIIRLPYRSAAK